MSNLLILLITPILLALLGAYSLAAQTMGGGGGGGGGTGGGGGAPNNGKLVTTTGLTLTISSAEHGNGHGNLFANCINSSGAALQRVATPAANQFNYVVDQASFLVTITFGTGGNNGGKCYVNGSGVGLQGGIGPSGPTGPSGPAGIQGNPGTPGSPGVAGSQGPVGPTGPTGIQGFQGPVGAQGPEGDIGPQGPAGSNGLDGEVTDEAVQSGRHIIAVDTASTDDYQVTMFPAPIAYDSNGVYAAGEIMPGQIISFRPSSTNIGPSTLQVNSLASRAIVMPDGTPTTDGALTGSRWYVLTSDNANNRWQIGTGAGGTGTGGTGVTDAQLQSNSRQYCPDSGSTDAYVCNASPSITAYTTGMVIWFKPNTTNVTNAFLTLSGLAQKEIYTESNAVLVDSMLKSGQTYPMWYDGTHWRLIGSSYIDPDPTFHEGEVMITPDAVTKAYSKKLFLPPDTQTVTTNTPLILNVSSNIYVTPDAARTWCTATGIIEDGTKEGQWITIHNTTPFPQMIRDLLNCTGSKMDFGGTDQLLNGHGSLNVVWNGPYWRLRDRNIMGAITISFSGGGSAITAGYTTPPVVAAFPCKIQNWSIAGSPSGSLVVDIWKSSSAIPTVADTITASAKPTLSSGTQAKSQAVTGWTTFVNVGDTLIGKVDSATTITGATVTLACLK